MVIPTLAGDAGDCKLFPYINACCLKSGYPCSRYLEKALSMLLWNADFLCARSLASHKLTGASQMLRPKGPHTRPAEHSFGSASLPGHFKSGFAEAFSPWWASAFIESFIHRSMFRCFSPKGICLSSTQGDLAVHSQCTACIARMALVASVSCSKAQLWHSLSAQARASLIIGTSARMPLFLILWLCSSNPAAKHVVYEISVGVHREAGRACGTAMGLSNSFRSPIPCERSARCAGRRD